MGLAESWAKGWARGRDRFVPPGRGVPPATGDDRLKQFLKNPLTAAAATGLGMITAGGGLARSGLLGPKVSGMVSSPAGAAITLGAGALGLGLTTLKFIDIMRDIVNKARQQTAETVTTLGQRLGAKIKGDVEPEPEKTAEEKDKDKENAFAKTVHHPLIQGAGYGALAAEGVHALGERGMFGKKMQKWTHTTTGRRLGHAAIAGSAGFLGAEALAALSGLRR